MFHVETEWHFVMECAPYYEDISIQYERSLKVDNMHHLCDEDKVNQIANVLIKIHNNKSYIKNNMKMI